MDVAVQHGDRAKLPEIGKRLGAIVRAPAPFGIHRPEWNMSKHHDGRAAGKMLHIVFQPLQLLLAQATETTRLEVQDVDQANEMCALLIEAVPAATFRSLTVALQILLPVVAENVVLSRHVEHVAWPGFL